MGVSVRILWTQSASVPVLFLLEIVRSCAETPFIDSQLVQTAAILVKKSPILFAFCLRLCNVFQSASVRSRDCSEPEPLEATQKAPRKETYFDSYLNLCELGILLDAYLKFIGFSLEFSRACLKFHNLPVPLRRVPFRSSQESAASGL